MRKLFSVVIALCAATSLSLAATSVNVICGNAAEISATPATGYHFVQWNDGNTQNPRTIIPTEDVTYTATFALNTYTITFKNEDGTVLQTDEYTHGDPVVYNGATPTKASTAEFKYTFSGWSPTINSTATEAAVYVAQFDAERRKYTITFKNWDGSILESKEWEYGTTPTYAGSPTRPADAENTYSFSGWNVTISPVSGTAEYIAQYNASTQTYTIATAGENGTVDGGGTFQYGTEITLTATADDCFKFVQWNDGNTNATRSVTVTGAATYTATFEQIKYTVTVVADDATHGTVSVMRID